MGEHLGPQVGQKVSQSCHWYVCNSMCRVCEPRSELANARKHPGSVCIIAWTAAPTAAIYLAASVLQSTIAMNIPSYDPKGWHITLIMWAILLVCTVLNTWLGMILPVIEVLILLVHVLGFFAVLVPLVYLGPKADPRSIFTVSFDYGGWGDLTLATFIGLKGTVAAFVGKADFRV